MLSTIIKAAPFGAALKVNCLSEFRFAFFHLVGLAVVLDFTRVLEVDLGLLDSPPAVIVLEDASFVEGDLTVSGLPPAVVVLVDAVSLEVDLAVFDSPPAVLILVNAGGIEVHLTLRDLPPAEAVLGHTGIGRVDDAVAGGHPDAVDLRDFDAFGGGGHAAVVWSCCINCWSRGGKESVQLRHSGSQAVGAEWPQEATEQDQSHCQACCNSVKFVAGSTVLGVRNHASFLAHNCPLLRHFFYPNYTGKSDLSQAKQHLSRLLLH